MTCTNGFVTAAALAGLLSLAAQPGIGYGMWGMAGWTGSDDGESRQSLDRAVAMGCNFFDTAWAATNAASAAIMLRHAGAGSLVAD